MKKFMSKAAMLVMAILSTLFLVDCSKQDPDSCPGGNCNPCITCPGPTCVVTNVDTNLPSSVSVAGGNFNVKITTTAGCAACTEVPSGLPAHITITMVSGNNFNIVYALNTGTAPHGSHTASFCGKNVTLPPQDGTMPQPPSVDIDADNKNLPYNGSTTVRWTSQNIVGDCVANGIGAGWAGIKPSSGNFSTGNLTTAATTYSIRCTGTQGQVVDDSVTINVAPAPPVLATLSWRLCSGTPSNLDQCSPVGSDKAPSYAVPRNADFKIYTMITHNRRSECVVSGRMFSNIGDGSSDVLQSQPEAGAPNPIWLGYAFNSRTVAAGNYMVTLDFFEQCTGFEPHALRDVVNVIVQP